MPERCVELVAVEQLPAPAVRGETPGGHQFADGARGDARVGDGFLHRHPWGGCLGCDPVRQPRGDASRDLVGQQVEVDFEPQRWSRGCADVRNVGTQE